jgi:Fic family protein
MKIPKRPPKFGTLIQKAAAENRLSALMELGQKVPDNDYVHWDKLRHLPAPTGFSSEEWWAAIKFQRAGSMRALPLRDKFGEPFTFSVPEVVQIAVHQIDVGAGHSLGLPEPITNPQTRDQYLVRSLIEEAITSSQLEGAVTTREVAKEMIRSGRAPRDNSERMILNNYLTMQRITELRGQALSPDLVFAVHKLVTEKTLDDASAAGRLRRPDEIRVVGDDYGSVFHEPPDAEQLQARLQAMCDFANAKTPGFFIHPVVRGIILHFWLAYDHPFVDGNGRTARALFYWQMLHEHYWLFEFISISNILRKAPVQYGMSFLHSETDANDLTYFIVAQTKVIRRAIDELHEYIDRKTAEVRLAEAQLRALNLFNHRQADLIRHALKHPNQEYTIAGHGKSYNVVYQTARTDLLDLVERGVLLQKTRSKKMIFKAAQELVARLKQMENAAAQLAPPRSDGSSGKTPVSPST